MDIILMILVALLVFTTCTTWYFAGRRVTKWMIRQHLSECLKNNSWGFDDRAMRYIHLIENYLNIEYVENFSAGYKKRK